MLNGIAIKKKKTFKADTHLVLDTHQIRVAHPAASLRPGTSAARTSAARAEPEAAPPAAEPAATCAARHPHRPEARATTPATLSSPTAAPSHPPAAISSAAPGHHATTPLPTIPQATANSTVARRPSGSSPSPLRRRTVLPLFFFFYDFDLFFHGFALFRSSINFASYTFSFRPC